MIRPPSKTRIRVARLIELKRCAIMNVVRPAISCFKACCTFLFALGIQRARGFVERDRRVLQKAREGNALALSTR